MKTVLDFAAAKTAGRKISMVTCYDSTSAKIIANSNIDCILVGDSAAMTMHGFNEQFVKNGAVALASGATVTAPAGPTWVVVAGAGGFTAPVTVGAVAIPANSFMHVRKTAA